MGEWFAALTVSDWASVGGTIVAALIGVGALAITFGVEARSRYTARLDEALAGVILALAERADSVDRWSDAEASASRLSPVSMDRIRWMAINAPGGPSDANVQAAVEIAWLAARGRDRACMSALADATFSLKRAVVTWQVDRSGRVAAAVRRWRTGELPRRAFIEEMTVLGRDAIASGEAHALKRGLS